AASGSVRLRGNGRRRVHRQFVSALETLAGGPHGLGLLLFHSDKAAIGTRDGYRTVPHRKVAVRVAGAAEEIATLPRAALGDVTLAALGAGDAERHGSRVLALGKPRAGQEFAEPAGLDDHRRAALLADLVGGFVGHLVPTDRLGKAALFRIPGACNERSE